MEYIEYIDEGEYVTLYRMYGAGAIAEIPRTAAGKPVKALADHLFAAEPSVLYKKERIKRVFPDGETCGYMDAESPSADAAPGRGALSGTSIEIIRIPEGVERIGNYAFYGCSSLREVSFPSTLKQIGHGMFNGCGKVSRLNFSEKEEQEAGMQLPSENIRSGAADTDVWQTPAGMKEVLDAVSNEIEAVSFRRGAEQWRLTFPEYYEEGKENTPARIIEIVYHGTGHQYRNCFLNRKIQFDRYDEVFPLAAAQERAETCISIIRNRLRRGPAPGKEWGGRYIDYLRSESDLLLDSILKEREYDPVAELKILEQADFFTSNIIDAFIEEASSQGRSDAVIFLMDVKRRRFGAAKRSRYEL